MPITTKCGILIRFEQPQEPLCALCMLFNPLFDDLHQSVTTAANQVGLKVERVDNNREDAQWINRIFTILKKAKLVVSILAYEEGRPFPNPNVMYEIGFAHALGKATLLMAPRSKELPSELYSFDYYIYDEDIISTRNFRESLQNQLHMLLDSIGNSYVQKGPSGAEFLFGPPLLLYDKSLLCEYWFLLDYISIIRDQMQNLFSNFIKPLSYSSRVLKRRGNPAAENTYEFRDLLDLYKHHYEFMTRVELFSKYEFQRDKANKALEELITSMEDFWDKEQGREAFKNIHKYLEEFRRYHDRMLDSADDLSTIAIDINKVEQTVSRVLGYTSALTKALVELLEPQER